MTKFSIQRVIVLLLLINAIKLPPESVPVVYWPNLAADAVATPYVILSAHQPIPQEILVHEQCHIRQMNTYGSLWFYVVNLYYLRTRGYDDNPFEQQAYQLCR